MKYSVKLIVTTCSVSGHATTVTEFPRTVEAKNRAEAVEKTRIWRLKEPNGTSDYRLAIKRCGAEVKSENEKDYHFV